MLGWHPALTDPLVRGRREQLARRCGVGRSWGDQGDEGLGVLVGTNDGR